jgi:poly(3-hydroxybutyrate) depolymerase
MKATLRTLFLAATLVLSLIAVAGAQEHALNRQSLKSYQVDISQSSVSGLSAGAYMADQFFVAFSDHMVGVGIFAGGPYGCARGNLGIALSACMSQPQLLNSAVMQTLHDTAKDRASAGKIDSLDNLRTRRSYIFSGTSDTTVRQGVTDWVGRWYELAGMPAQQILYNQSFAVANRAWLMIKSSMISIK